MYIFVHVYIYIYIYIYKLKYASKNISRTIKFRSLFATSNEQYLETHMYLAISKKFMRKLMVSTKN